MDNIFTFQIDDFEEDVEIQESELSEEKSHNILLK